MVFFFVRFAELRVKLEPDFFCDESPFVANTTNPTNTMIAQANIIYKFFFGITTTTIPSIFYILYVL